MLLTNIPKVEPGMTVERTGGTLTANYKGFLPNYGDVWLNKRAVTNILLQKKLIMF